MLGSPAERGKVRIFHIAAASAWDESAESYAPDTLDSEGFIHCSDPRQVMTVLGERVRGANRLLLLEIDPGRVAPEIRYENLEGGQESFPHIYGPLNREAVLAAHPLVAGPSGDFSTPDALSRWL